MATDGPDPVPCRQDLFEHGDVVKVFGEVGGSNRFERLVQMASRSAGVPIDWHFSGGRAVVLAMPCNFDKALEALKRIVEPVLAGRGPEGCLLVREDDEKKGAS